MDKDVVYLCKQADTNEELIYSIRSVVKNFPHRKIWIYGGCPTNLKIENYVHVNQTGVTKWDRVRNMMRLVALNDDITEDFYLFNDDFYIMEKITEVPVCYRSTLPEHILDIEAQYGDRPTKYTSLLRRMYREIVDWDDQIYSYELHIPFLFNRKKLLAIVKRFPNYRATRTVYGNFYKIGGSKMADVKEYGAASHRNTNTKTFLSTDDLAWRNDHFLVRTKIKKTFPEKSPYEV